MNTDSIRDTLNMTAGTIGRDLLQSLVQEIKLLPDVWPKLPKAKQDDVIDRLRDRVENNIRMAVHMIASEGRAVADATLEQVTLKGRFELVDVYAAPVPASVPNSVIELLTHIEDVVPDDVWEEIDHKLWNVVTKQADGGAKP